MGVHIPTLPDARSGHRNRGVAPIHVPGARIGMGARLVVAQPKERQRHGRPGAVFRGSGTRDLRNGAPAQLPRFSPVRSLVVGEGGVSLADFLSVSAGHWFDTA